MARAESCFVCGIVLVLVGGYSGSALLFSIGGIGLSCAAPLFLVALLPWCCHGCCGENNSCPAAESQRRRHRVACMVGSVLLLIAGIVAYETGNGKSLPQRFGTCPTCGDGKGG